MKRMKRSSFFRFSYFLIIIFIIGIFPSIFQSLYQNQGTNNEDYTFNTKDSIDNNTITDSSEFITENDNTNLTGNEKLSVSSLNPGFGERIWEFCRTCYKNEIINQITFSPDMKFLAGGTNSGKIHIFDVTNGVELYILGNSNEMIKSLVWSKDSKTLVSLYKDSILNYWNIENGTLTKQIDFASRISGIRNFAISNDGKKLVIASYDRKISLWTFDGEFLSYIVQDSKSYILELKFSNNNSLLAAFTATGKIWVWSLQTLNVKLNSSINLDTTFTSYYKGNAIDFSPHDNLLFVSFDISKKIVTFDLSTKNKTTNLVPTDGDANSWVNSVSHNKNENIIAYVTKYKNGYGFAYATIYDYTNNKTLLNLKSEESVVEFSKDGSMLAVLNREQFITIYNTIQNSEIATLSGHIRNAYMTKFLNQSILVSADLGSVKIWRNNTLLKSIDDSRISEIDGLDITENSKRDILVSFSGYFNNIPGYIFIYNLTSDFLNIYTNNGVDIVHTNFSPNSSLLVSTDGTKVKIWNVDPFVLVNEIDFSYEGGIASEGFLFVTNTLLIGSPGITGKIVELDINGTIISSYTLEVGSGLYAPIILALTLSADRTILGMEVANSYVAYLNLTNGEHHSKQLTDFISIDSLTTFSDIVVTPDNRYIIGIAGFYHSLFIVDINDLSLRANFPLDVKDYLFISLEPKTWTLAVGKSDYTIGLYDLSYLRDNKINLFDFDCDGMPDTWENAHSLDSGKYWDRFEDPDQDNVVNWEESLHQTNPHSKDTDNDSITDTYEIEYGLDPNLDDSLLDIDHDGMNNLYEFRMGLDSSINDSYFDYDNDGLTNLQEFYYQTDVHNPDTDFDGMPDKWEVENRLNATSALDASKDFDLDGISNLDEFMAGTDPNSFFSVPLVSINNFYIAIVLIISITSLFSYIEYRRYITNKYISPDYSSAVKAKNAGLDSWYDYTREFERVEKQLKEAKTTFLEGFIDQSITMYYSILDSLKLLSKEIYIAETLVRILFISQKMQKSNPFDFKKVYEKFPVKNRNALIRNYYNYVQAYENEAKNNLGLATELFNKVHSSNLMSPEFSLMAFYSIISLLIEKTQIDKSKALSDSIQSKLVSLRSQAQKADLYEFVCASFILQARFLFYNYKLDEATEYLEKATDTATEKHIYYFIEKAADEVKEFNLVKDTIKQHLSLNDESTLSQERNFEEYKRKVMDYAVLAKEIIERERDT